MDVATFFFFTTFLHDSIEVPNAHGTVIRHRHQLFLVWAPLQVSHCTEVSLSHRHQTQLSAGCARHVVHLDKTAVPPNGKEGARSAERDAVEVLPRVLVLQHMPM